MVKPACKGCRYLHPPRQHSFPTAWDRDGGSVCRATTLCGGAGPQDAVARSAKFWVFYKRAGQRVLINDRGDMLVRPTFTELSIQQSPMGSSVFHVSAWPPPPRVHCARPAACRPGGVSLCCKLHCRAGKSCPLAYKASTLSSTLEKAGAEPAVFAVWQHYMLAYRDSLAAVCTAQMNRKKRMQVWPC